MNREQLQKIKDRYEYEVPTVGKDTQDIPYIKDILDLLAYADELFKELRESYAKQYRYGYEMGKYLKDCETLDIKMKYMEQKLAYHVYMDKLKAKKKASKDNVWIPCSRRLPKHGERVLTLIDYTEQIIIGYYDVEGMWRDNECGIYDGVTHWMSLPKSPVKSKDNK